MRKYPKLGIDFFHKIFLIDSENGIEMSIFSNREIDTKYKTELAYREKIDESQDHIINALSTIGESDDIEIVNEAFRKVGRALGEAFSYNFCEISIIRGERFRDFDIYLNPSLEIQKKKSSSINNLAGDRVSETFAWQIIKEEKDLFFWHLSEDGPINKSNLVKRYRGLQDPKYFIRLKKYFAKIFPKGLTDLVVIPLYFRYENYTPLGAIVLCNRLKSEGSITNVEKDGIRFLSRYISTFLEGYINLSNANKINSVVASLYKSYIEDSLEIIQKFLIELFNAHFVSFWVPTFQEDIECIVLRKVVFDDEFKLDEEAIKSNDYYHLTNTFLGTEIANFLNNRRDVVESHDLKLVGTGFLTIEKIPSDQVVTVIISDGDRDPYEILGVFTIYPKRNSVFSEYHFDKCNAFASDITNYLKFAIYKRRYNSVQAFKNKLKSIDFSDYQSFYKTLCMAIKNVMASEACSIFFYNADKKGLYLKYSTANRFFEVKKENREVLDILPAAGFFFNEDKTIYSNSGSITYRVFSERRPKVVFDVFNEDLISDTRFCEETFSSHKSYIGCPITVNNEVVGVIRCINKISTDDTFLANYITNDLEIFTQIAGISSKMIENIELQNAQNVFFDRIAHEIRTPTQILYFAIKNAERKFASKINDSQLSLEMQRAFKKITLQGSLINNIYNNMNVMVEIKKEKFDVKLESVDLRKQIEDVSTLIEPLLMKSLNHSITIQNHISQMPKFRLDEQKILQVLYNLLVNAAKYSTRHARYIDIYYKEPDQVVDINEEFIKCVEIRICNEGIGIKDEDIFQIFEEYYRSKEAINENPSGSGIGLYVSQNIVKAHGGIIKVTKQENPTTISIFLPEKLKINEEEGTVN